MNVEDFLIRAFNWTSEHPIVANVLFWGFVVGTVIQTVLRAVWPKADARPKWAAALIAIADPFAGNLWRLLAWFLGKVGLKIRNPFDETASLAQQPEVKP